jgi:hypothetical protein
VNWVQLDAEGDDHDHLISPEERFRVAMVRQQRLTKDDSVDKQRRCVTQTASGGRMATVGISNGLAARLCAARRRHWRGTPAGHRG